jgi:micrococcal nuclease
MRIVVAICIAAITAAGCAWSRSGDETRATPAPTASTVTSTVAPPDDLCAAARPFCSDPTRMQAAAVVKIIDGDTLDVMVGGRQERVRIFGIDTTERGEPCFADASQRLAELAGDQIRMVSDIRERDRNGRLLRYVYTAGGVSIDATLVAEGLAHAWTRDGAFRDDLIALEVQSRAEERGCLWRP